LPSMPSESSGQVGAAEPIIWTMLPGDAVVATEPAIGTVTQMEPVLSMATEIGLPGLAKAEVQVVDPPIQGRYL